MTLCWSWRIWSFADYTEYQEVRRFPLGNELWFGRIVAGQAIEPIIEQTPPHRVRKYGRFTRYGYYAGGPLGPNQIAMEGLGIVTKDGRVISAGAGGCTWQHVFFDMSPEDQAEYERTIQEHLKNQ